jgi:energy-coupling factor transporter transmembrane protein EcfT
MNIRISGIVKSDTNNTQLFGTLGHLAIFFWFLAMVMLVSPIKMLPVIIICLSVALILYPFAFKQVIHWRWLLLMLLLSAPAIFLIGELDREFIGIPYSSEGLLAGFQIGCRFVIVLIAVEAFTCSVDIPAIGGLLERVGMQGLGFSIGVALNLVPSLQNASRNTWQSLWMRGGLRRKWMRGLKLLAVTIISNAIRQAEEIALAAETRAFSPEKSRPLPIQRGQIDWIPIVLGIVCIAGLLLI